MHHKQLAATKGPLLITANHPNSFLDAIIIGSLFTHPVHFLARGDAFQKPWHRTVLSWLNMIPIYRLSEGKDKLHLNDYAFTRSCNILEDKGIVLIFIEGICVHQHTLQPFKKGAARIALQCWQNGIPVQVMPVGISYSSFTHFAKSVVVHLSPTLQSNSLIIKHDLVKSRLHFNTVVQQHLQPIIHYPVAMPGRANLVVRFFALIGRYLHQPLYRPLQQWVQRITQKTVFYHSVLFGVLLLAYPLYLLLLFVVLLALSVPLPIVVLAVAVHPLLAWVAVRYQD